MTEVTLQKYGGPLSNKSVVWVAAGKAELQHRDVPEMGPKDVLVEVIITGICGSDAHVWASNPAKPPPVMGHESAGTVIRVGTQVTDRAVGQKVAIEPSFPCMDCEFCIRGQPNICTNLNYCGHTANGTLCQYFVCRSQMAVPVPNGVTWEEAGCIQPLAIAVQLARRANMRAHQTIAVFGCGPLGLLVMAVAKSYGASRILAFDVEQSRIDFALKHYADVGIQCPLNKESAEPLEFASDFVNSVIQQYSLGSGVDLAIEASGADPCISMGVMITKNGGTYVQAGLGKSLSLVPMFQVTAKELTIKGTVRFTPGCFSDAIDLLQRKAVDVKPLITAIYPMSDIQEAFRAQNARKYIKIVIKNQE